MCPSYVEVSLDTYRLIQQGHFTWTWIFLTYLKSPYCYFQNWAHFEMLLPVILPCRGAGPDDCTRGSTRLSLSPEAWVSLKSKIFLFLFIYNKSFYCSSYFSTKLLITTSFLRLFRSYYELADNFILFLCILQSYCCLCLSHRCSCFLHVGIVFIFFPTAYVLNTGVCSWVGHCFFGNISVVS